VAINSNGWFRSGELQSGNSVKVATVAGKQYATVADHDPGDETVGHADGIARALGRFANIAGSVSRVVVQFERRHCREKLRKTGKLFRVPGSREKFESRDNSGSERLTLEQQIHGVGCAFACEKIDQDIRIRDDYRQFSRIPWVTAYRAWASDFGMEPLSASAFRTALVRLCWVLR